MTRLLLHSGGLDSHCLWLMDRDRTPVYVLHGSRNEAQELVALDRLHRADPTFEFVTVPGPLLGPIARTDAHIPHRNALLILSALAFFPDATEVAYGALLGEGSKDKSAAFRRALTRLTERSEKRVEVVAPLSRMTKASAVRKATALSGTDWIPLTVSCTNGTECGRCQACFRRSVALYLCGIISVAPEWPTETEGPWATVKANPPSRWPALALSNLDVLRMRRRR